MAIKIVHQRSSARARSAASVAETESPARHDRRVRRRSSFPSVPLRSSSPPHFLTIQDRRVRAGHSLVAVLVPVLGRPANVRPLVESLARSGASAHLYFLATDNDRAEVAACLSESRRAPEWCSLYVLPSPRRSWSKKINDGVRLTREPWLLLGADDLRFHLGWLEAAALLMGFPKIGVIGTCDLGHPGTREGWHSTHPLVRRTYAARGTEDDPRALVHEGYHHNFPDTELVATARKRGAYAHCGTSIVEHLHPLWGKARDDATYRLGQSRIRQDRARFFQRLRQFGWESRG